MGADKLYKAHSTLLDEGVERAQRRSATPNVPSLQHRNKISANIAAHEPDDPRAGTLVHNGPSTDAYSSHKLQRMNDDPF